MLAITRNLKRFETYVLKPYFCGPLSGRRGVRVVEGARLESVYSGNAIAGSNPALSAKMMAEESMFLLTCRYSLLTRQADLQ
jgi:hypothetical protein